MLAAALFEVAVAVADEGVACDPVAGDGGALGGALLPTPGFCVRSTNCVPSAIGPLGFARHEPGGFKGEL